MKKQVSLFIICVLLASSVLTSGCALTNWIKNAVSQQPQPEPPPTPTPTPTPPPTPTVNYRDPPPGTTHPDFWNSTYLNLSWSMAPNNGVDPQAHNKMWDSVMSGNPDRMGELQAGFYESQNSPNVRAQFDFCMHDNPRWLFNMGRKIAGLKPI
jgi:hypothetical protein